MSFAFSTMSQGNVPTTSHDSNLEQSTNNYDLDERHNFAHLVSSTERFAKSHGMTPQQVKETAEARKQGSVNLQKQLLALDNEASMENSESDKKRIGTMKHQLICQSRYIYLRNPFVCRQCWTHLPICVCSLFDRKIPLPQKVHGVYVWTHHDEWGRSSNTGSLLPLALEDTHMLMKGLSDHDELFRSNVLDITKSRKQIDFVPVVLWPGKRSGDNPSTTLPEIQQMLYTANDGNQSMISKEIILVAIEGTWNNAKKMASKLPPHVLRLDIGEEIPTLCSDLIKETNSKSSNPQLPQSTSPSRSILAPLRRQGKGRDGIATNVSTLEATIIALLGLGLEKEDAMWLLSTAKEKIDRIRQFTGKVHDRS